jgi:hypothetical protein
MNNDVQLKVELTLDTDGFLSQECPACLRRFKAHIEAGDGKELRFCPYCRHEGLGCWWTPAQAEYFGQIASDKIVAPMLERMARNFNSSMSKGGLIQVTMSTSQRRHSPRPPVEPDLEMPLAYFSCCDERIKHDSHNQSLNCVICGCEVSLATMRE